MGFSSPPEQSINQINKAGQTLVDRKLSQDVLDKALELANQWRACHAYPINTFRATLGTYITDFKDPIIAQRLKRMPTIVDKLRRYPNMKLSTMQDIGGLRAVLSTVSEVHKLANRYKTNKRLTHTLIKEYDYISNPRDEDGYRSVHLIYKYRNKRTPIYNGLRIELQIRTRIQHTWATAVETMGTLLGQALKSRKGDQEWLDFFAIVSSAFAHQENTAPIPRYKGFSYKQTLQEVVKAEKILGAIDKMQGFAVAVDAISKQHKGWSYHLLILDSIAGKVQIKSYALVDYPKAIADYNNEELNASRGAKIEPVLVSVGPIDKLRRAYPNFFLDIGEFVKHVTACINKA